METLPTISKKHVKQFSPGWLRDHKMRAWIRKVEDDATKFECRVCNTVYAISSVHKHMKQKGHMDKLAAYMAAPRDESEADDDELEKYLNPFIYYFIKKSYKKLPFFLLVTSSSKT